MVDTPMPLTAHLAELRSRLIWCMVALAVGFIVCYGFSDKIVGLFAMFEASTSH
jgi:sec-independent protein translocase protein TatC